MKAERVQIWQRVVETTRSLAARIYDFFKWLEKAAGTIKEIARSFLFLRK